MINKACPHCQTRISLAWFITASSNEQYRCLNCSKRIGFGKIASPVSLVIAVLQVIATLFVWHIYDQAYPLLIEHQVNGFQANLFFAFSLVGLLISARLFRLLIPSRQLLKLVD